ncbi:hypothetical protein HUE88_02085 [Candidatus Sulfurimonas baltica]|uniref:Helicase/UvrB N-terminal domain-containing protein n=1 Tax=Candidatus Sulfurimonas baltica TaxID=2740404 RepID=A0A7S7LT46_9BACT|nr:hypothetical protein HUE88_02085 [Candidatus Sulfurimonas baltica]
MTKRHCSKCTDMIKIVDFEATMDNDDLVLKGNRYQTLEGVTGSGKTYTMAKVIESELISTLS